MSLNSDELWPNLLEKVAIADKIQKISLAVIENEMFDIFKNKFNTAIRIHFFGSRIMGIAEESSDLDVYVDIDNSFNEYNYKLTYKLRMHQAMISSAFKAHPNWLHEASFGGQCPVVKVERKISGMKCDISFSNGLTIHQNELVMYFFKKQPIARYMVIYLRGWMKDLQLQEEFRSHILVLMVIYFLQIHNFLPGVKNIQKNISPTIRPWVTTFNNFYLCDLNMVEIKVEEREMRQILKQFFSYFATFKFSQYAICPYLGIEVERNGFERNMPSCFQRDNKFYRDTIVVQDLIHLSHNKGWIISKQSIMKFQEKCKVESQ